MHLDVPSILSLLSLYGYPALGILVAISATGTPLPFPMTTTFVTLGALTAAAHGPNFLALVIVGTLAAAVGHSADYGLGRSTRPFALRWRGRLERRIGSQTLGGVERWLDQSSTLVILLTRFPLTPLASPVSLGAGLMRVTYRRFLALELTGKSAYFTTCLLLGRLFGPEVTSHLGFVILGSLLVTLLLSLTSVALVRMRARPSSQR
ncbi:MAG TPA: VTT domain-containing protein [Ktedonobacterales bacterium]